MAAASGIRAGRAFVELFADDRKLVAGLRLAQRRIAAFGAAVRQTGMQLAGIGLGAVAGLGLAARSFAQTGSALNDMAQRTGLSVEALSELGYAAGLSGASLDDVERAVRVMQKQIGAAAAGSDGAAAAFSRLGLSVNRLIGSAPEAQFAAVAAALRGIPDPTQRAAAAMAVFGKSGTALLPMIGELDALRTQARKLGVVMSTTQAQAADALGDAFDRVGAAAGGVVNAIGTALAPVLIVLAQRVTTFLVGLRDWIAQNQGLVVTILGVAATVAVVGTALIGLGLTVAVIAAALGGLATLASLASAALGLLGTIAAAIFSPIGALVAGVVALAGAIGYVLVTQTATGQPALGMLADGFWTLHDDAVTAWGGIADALAAGDIGLAAQVVWATLKLEWERGTAFLANLWDAAITGFAQLFASAWYGILDVFWSVVYGIADAWDWVVGGITKL